MALIFMIIVIVIFSMALIKSANVNESSVIIDFDSAVGLKGYAIIVVFLHHFGQLSSDYNEHSFLGCLAVALFLLIAGYVTEKQYIKQGEKYLSFSFFYKKFLRIILPYIMIKIGLSVIGDFSIKKMFVSIIHIENDWFLSAILFFYIVFYFTKRFADKFANKLIFIVSVFYLINCISSDLSSAWYNTAFSFWIGVFVATNENEIKNKNQENFRKHMGTVLPFFLCVTFLEIIRVFPVSITSSISAFCFTCIVVLLLCRFSFQNRILIFLGSYSWEFYLLQSRVLMKVGEYLYESPILWGSIAFFISLIGAIAVKIILDKSLTIIVTYTSRFKRKEM